MEVKPTFFSISGFLVPGVVLFVSISCLLLGHYYGSIRSTIEGFPSIPAQGASAVLVGTLAAVAFLAFSFVAGAVLSDTFIFVGRRLILRPWKRGELKENVKRLFEHKTVEELIRADMDARESYVYMHTCGLDLDWYAGRIRMMGGTGLALIIAAVFALILKYSCATVFCFAISAALAIWVALYRSNKFDQYIAAASAVIARGGGENRKEVKEIQAR
jgi:hypothetical protein